MSTEKPKVTIRDLVEEAKKRIVLLIVCVVGLSYLMSLTSSSVIVNLPAAAFILITFRYLSLDFETRKKAASYKSRSSSATPVCRSNSPEGPKDPKEHSDWRLKVNSPPVEEAIDHFTRHIVSEWVTDLWYSRITPDRQGPEELVQIMNGVLAEISGRMRAINLIELLTRDVVNIICSQLELFRSCKAKIETKRSKPMSIEERDVELKLLLAAEKKLHPALFSSEAEHKVLQNIVDGLISYSFKADDLRCSLFRYIVRELLACVVLRPVLNLASPRFINERIESLVMSLRKTDKGTMSAQTEVQSKSVEPAKIASDHFSRFLDPSVRGVELVQLKKDQSNNVPEESTMSSVNGTLLSKDPLLSIDTRSTRSWSSLPTDNHTGEEKGIQRHRSGGEWGEMLDALSRRKTEALAPEHFDNMWTKGRNYKRKEEAKNLSKSKDHAKVFIGQKRNGDEKKSFIRNRPGCNSFTHKNGNSHPYASLLSDEEDDDHASIDSEDVESGSASSYTTEDEETSNITGLDSPGIRVWDGKNKRSVTHIHHPLENIGGQRTRKAKIKKSLLHKKGMDKADSGRKRSRHSSKKEHVWQESGRTSFSLREGKDLLNSTAKILKNEHSSDDSEAEMFGRIGSGATASSSVSLHSLPEKPSFPADLPRNSVITDTFYSLRCEVLGANIVKSGSKTFAVYCIAVTDINSNSWSVKRRFQHFEELHRHLKEFPEYNLHLPPKHFLSTGLDVPVILERCQLLDKYLKNLLQLPVVSTSIEVWDFLSVDSQMYGFSNSLSIVDTLSVHLEFDAHDKRNQHHDFDGFRVDPQNSKRQHPNAGISDSSLHVNSNDIADNLVVNRKTVALSPAKKPVRDFGGAFEDSSGDSDGSIQKKKVLATNLEKTLKTREDSAGGSSELLNDAASDPTLPSEWVPPNLSVPILDLVDVIFQLQDGGWIRRKAFWVAKQVLQLGMGDAFDDWLIEKIQLLRRGTVVAAGVRRVEQILWPDGIFITKHPRRQRPAPVASSSFESPRGRPPYPLSSPKMEDLQKMEEMQKVEAEGRAKLVYELMIDKAPAAIVGLVGSKEYEQCAKDLYYFIQSSVFLRLLVYDLLELLLLSAFPELDCVFRQFHEEKEKFGELLRE